MTLYRCDGYDKDNSICNNCPAGEPHKAIGACNIKEEACSVRGIKYTCMEYDNGLPCNIPDCPEHTGGDGEICNS